MYSKLKENHKSAQPNNRMGGNVIMLVTAHILWKGVTAVQWILSTRLRLTLSMRYGVISVSAQLSSHSDMPTVENTNLSKYVYILNIDFIVCRLCIKEATFVLKENKCVNKNNENYLSACQKIIIKIQ